MGRAKQTKRFATMKRMISASDPRLKVIYRNDNKWFKKGVLDFLDYVFFWSTFSYPIFKYVDSKHIIIPLVLFFIVFGIILTFSFSGQG